MTSEFGDDALLQDALYELSLAKPAPDASVLEDLVRSYPQFAQELTEAAVELRLDALKGRDEEPLETNPEETRNAVLKAMSRFHNRLHALRARRFTIGFLAVNVTAKHLLGSIGDHSTAALWAFATGPLSHWCLLPTMFYAARWEEHRARSGTPDRIGQLVAWHRQRQARRRVARVEPQSEQRKDGRDDERHERDD